MPKKDTAAAVLGMLSTTGAQTRSVPAADSHEERTGPHPGVTVTKEAGGSDPARALPVDHSTEMRSEAPRTLRLRPTTAQGLRRAWLEAKRDDVLLTAQDFASDLVDEALVRRRRRPATRN